MEDFMSHTDRLKLAYKEWNDSKGKSHSHWLELMADDIVFHSLAGGQPGMEFTRKCHSKKDVEQYFSGLEAAFEMDHYTPEEFIEQGDRVVMRGSCAWTSKLTHKWMETPKVDIFHFENGKIKRFYEYYDTAKATAAGLP